MRWICCCFTRDISLNVCLRARVRMCARARARRCARVRARGRARVRAQVLSSHALTALARSRIQSRCPCVRRRHRGGAAKEALPSRAPPGDLMLHPVSRSTARSRTRSPTRTATRAC
eukprot:4515603-Pleurochrysis_carterae.AAC.1